MRRFLGFSSAQKSNNTPPNSTPPPENGTTAAPVQSTVMRSQSKGKHVAFVATPPPVADLEAERTSSLVAHLPPSLDSRHGLSCIPRSPTTPAPESAHESAPSTSEQDSSISQRPSQPHSLYNSHSHPTQYNQLSLSTSRAVSALSTTPSQRSFGYSDTAPYEPGIASSSQSISRLANNEEGTISAPTTWSEMVHEELVDNIGLREKTRQEVLYEIVASEERYVAELRSLVECYVRPLLHPLLTPTSPIPIPPNSTKGSDFMPPSTSTATIRTELPIAAKFLRAVNEPSYEGGWRAGRRASEIPEIDGSEVGSWNDTIRAKPYGLMERQEEIRNGNGGMLGTGTGTGQIYHSHSSSSLFNRSSPAPPIVATKSASRLSTLALRSRHPLRKAISSTKLQKKSIPKEELSHPVLPDGLRKVLEVVEGMLEGHERLSIELRRKWTADFPLVRGLGAIWSDQPWFLESYSAYILSLESALAAIDQLLPSPHSPNAPLYSPTSKLKSKSDKDDRKLSKFIMTLEEAAHDAGEGGLAICLSKALMRLGKLPLLMQSIFYHTDASTVEYERTRVMAVEIDRLVRSIENEMIAEDDREKVRDVFARIDGIKDKGLMAPRSSRILLEENSIWSSSDTPTPRRAVSDVASTGLSAARNLSSLSHNSGRSIRRLSDLVRSGSSSSVVKDGSMPKVGSKKDIWLIAFTDVVIRVQRTGVTTIPSSLSSSNTSPYSPQSSSRGQKKRRGKERNLYRFLKVERWESRDMSGSYGRRRSESLRARGRSGGRDDEVLEESSEDDDDDAESVMSFNYTNDEPTPNTSSRNFKLPFAQQPLRSISHSSTFSTLTAPIKPASPQTQSRTQPRGGVEAKSKIQEAQEAKFGTRLRSSQGWNRPVGTGGGARSVSSPSPINFAPTTSNTRNGKFDNPTIASRARSTTPTPFYPSTYSRTTTPIPISPSGSAKIPLPNSPGLLPVKCSGPQGRRRSSLTPSLGGGTPGGSFSEGTTPENSPLLKTPPTNHAGLGLSLDDDSGLTVVDGGGGEGIKVGAGVRPRLGSGRMRSRGESSLKVSEGYWEEDGVIFPIRA